MKPLARLQIVVAAATAFVATCAIGAQPEPNASGPIARFDTTKIDAGKASRGESVRFEFTVSNPGSEKLTLEAKPHCACTTAEATREIAPGSTGRITAVLDTSRFKGPVTKYVAVATNDPANKATNLELNVEVQVPVEVRPEEVVKIEAKAGEPASQEIEIVSSDGTPFRITSIAAIPCIKGSWSPTTAAPAHKLRVEASGDCPVGSFSHDLPVGTTHPKAATLPVKLTLTVKSSATIKPDRVFLRPSKGGTGSADEKWASAVVQITKPDGDPIHVSSATSSDPSVVATVRTIEQGRAYEVDVRAAGAQPGDGQRRAEIRVILDSPRKETIVIPVMIL